LKTILSPVTIGIDPKKDLRQANKGKKRNLSLLKNHAKSGASGQPLRGSPSCVEMIKQEARSHSTVTANIKSLKLP